MIPFLLFLDGFPRRRIIRIGHTRRGVSIPIIPTLPSDLLKLWMKEVGVHFVVYVVEVMVVIDIMIRS